jgi:BlaR1 peptidase M56
VAVQASAARLARRARLKKPPSVLVHPLLNEPCLCGLLAPAILLPEQWLSCGDGRLVEAILAHELAHARRHDHLVNLAQRLVEVVLFFSPAVHWLSQSLRRQREYCADALAVRMTRDPLALAGALESVARLRLLSQTRPALSASLGGQSASLLPRIQELIGMKPSRPRRRLWPIVALPASLIVALLVSACGLPQDQPSPRASHIPANTMQDGVSNGSSPEQASRLAAEPFRPLIAPTPAGLHHQISYDVRFIDLDVGQLRGLLKDGLKLVMQDADVSAWTVDHRAFADLLDDLARNKAATIARAPNATSFDGAPVTFFTSEQYVRSLHEKTERREATAADTIPKPQISRASRPIATNRVVGSLVEVKGSILPMGIQLSADLNDSHLASIPAHAARPGDKNIDATISAPEIIERHCRISCAVPNGSCLAVSLGSNAQQGRVAGVKTAVGERLILITPRPVILAAQAKIGVRPR